MARLLKRLPKEFQSMKEDEYGLLKFTDAKDWNDEYRLQDEAFKALEKRALFVWRFQTADSYAYYEVAKLKPLQLVWIPYMDMWEAPDYVIRGLQTKNIMLEMAYEQNVKKAIAYSQSKGVTA